MNTKNRTNQIQRVIVTVSGGVAEACHKSSDKIEVLIVDFDNAEQSEEGTVERAEQWLELAKKGLPLEECNTLSGYEVWEEL